MKCVIFAVVLGLAGGQIVKYSPGPHYDCSYCQPEQIHISFGANPNDITVTWSTFNNTLTTEVEYGEYVMDKHVRGKAKLFTDGGMEKRTQWIHVVQLKGLKYNTKYVYHVGSVYGWSEVFNFKTPPQDEHWVVRAAIYGDMGSENAHSTCSPEYILQTTGLSLVYSAGEYCASVWLNSADVEKSLSYLQNEAQQGHFDVILHVGDFAYDMDSNNARVGDQFMRQIQPLAATVPYMTCPGNHEQAYNFSNYASRFKMPGRDSSLYYSFDLGPVHFISISTEVYYFVKYGAKLIVNQFEWLKNDLAKANLPENRMKRPWLVVFGHRPMYCSNSDDIDCSYEYTRRGFFGYLALEPLLKEYGVDLVIWAHEHSYERTWPLYDGKVYNGSEERPYVDPNAPVHVITGSAGCKEDTDKFKVDVPAWSAFRSINYGYTRFKAYNNTHIYMEQVDVDRSGAVIDSFWLVKQFDSYSL